MCLIGKVFENKNIYPIISLRTSFKFIINKLLTKINFDSFLKDQVFKFLQIKIILNVNKIFILMFLNVN